MDSENKVKINVPAFIKKLEKEDNLNAISEAMTLEQLRRVISVMSDFLKVKEEEAEKAKSEIFEVQEKLREFLKEKNLTEEQFYALVNTKEAESEATKKSPGKEKSKPIKLFRKDDVEWVGPGARGKVPLAFADIKDDADELEKFIIEEQREAAEQCLAKLREKNNQNDQKFELVVS